MGMNVLKVGDQYRLVRHLSQFSLGHEGLLKLSNFNCFPPCICRLHEYLLIKIIMKKLNVPC